MIFHQLVTVPGIRPYPGVMLSGAMSPTHWIIVIALLVLLFGAKRLPDAARSLGRSARILKSEVSGLHADQETHPEPKPTAE